MVWLTKSKFLSLAYRLPWPSKTFLVHPQILRMNRFCFATILINVIFACFLLVAPAQTSHAQSGVGDIGEKILSVLGVGGEDSPGTQGEEQAGQESAGQKGKTEPETGSEGKTTDAEAEQETQADPGSTGGLIKQIWNFPFFKTGDTWLRVNQIVTALGILIFGGLLASFLSRLLGRISKRHKKIDPSAAALVQKTTFFGLILFVLVLVIQVAKVPLAFLTLILTAVVIGASIGAKNTIYDYLSGMILVLERPVRVNDCIEVGKQQGFVTDISGRFTIIRRFDGIDVLVPNSKLLENSVKNWTLQDLKLRGDIKVSVVYSSPVRQVSEILRQAIEENDEVLESPSAGVFLWEFGESSLDFWAWFWTDVNSPLDIWRIQSAIRYRILELFNEHGITIAFPQRDVHLDSSSPLRIQDAQAEKIDRETQRSRQQAVTSTDPADDRHDEKQKEANAQTEDELKEDHLGPHV